MGTDSNGSNLIMTEYTKTNGKVYEIVQAVDVNVKIAALNDTIAQHQQAIVAAQAEIAALTGLK